MTYTELLAHIGLFAERMSRRCAPYSRIVVCGTSAEAQAILQRLDLDTLSHILYIIATEDTANEEILGIPIRSAADNADNPECIVLLDYLNVMLAKFHIFRGASVPLINVYDSGSFYDEHTLISSDWQCAPKSEEDLLKAHDKNINREMIARYVAVSDPGCVELRTIEIETINRCNGSCSFCPVNKNADTRVFQRMSTELFEKIINQLAQMNYSGKLALFSNNEPFLDKRLIEFQKYAREHLPLCKMHLFTNGMLLTIEKFLQLIPYLDELIIDNYSDDGQIPGNLNEIITYCRRNPELIAKVTVVLRKQEELLSSRGGEASNRQLLPDVDSDTCALPFQQMIIRPDGKVSLCCNDPLGKYTLGDLTLESIAEVWRGKRFQHIRNQLKIGRSKLDKCRKCDSFHYYF